MIEKEVVLCVRGPACRFDHHGWDCPLSDPLGDVLRQMMDPLPNPILEQVRQDMLAKFLPTEEPK